MRRKRFGIGEITSGREHWPYVQQAGTKRRKCEIGDGEFSILKFIFCAINVRVLDRNCVVRITHAMAIHLTSVCQQTNDREWAKGEMNSRTIWNRGTTTNGRLWRIMKKKKPANGTKKKRKILRFSVFASSRLIRRHTVCGVKSDAHNIAQDD